MSLQQLQQVATIRHPVFSASVSRVGEALIWKLAADRSSLRVRLVGSADSNPVHAIAVGGICNNCSSPPIREYSPFRGRSSSYESPNSGLLCCCGLFRSDDAVSKHFADNLIPPFFGSIGMTFRRIPARTHYQPRD